jgi:hypothetical protein
VDICPLPDRDVCLKLKVNPRQMKLHSSKTGLAAAVAYLILVLWIFKTGEACMAHNPGASWGCPLVLAGLGGAGGAVVGSLIGVEVGAAGGCAAGGFSAMFTALPSAVFLGSVNGGLDYLHARNEANQQLEEDLLACEN